MGWVCGLDMSDLIGSWMDAEGNHGLPNLAVLRPAGRMLHRQPRNGVPVLGVWC
jgi:hypothetical protein